MTPELMNGLAWAAQEQTTKPPSNAYLLMFLAIGLFFWMLILRPQRQEQRKRQSMLDSLAKGDSVVTNGGIHGTVESIDKEKNLVALNVAPKITMRFSRGAITSIIPKKGQKGEGENGKGKEEE